MTTEAQPKFIPLETFYAVKPNQKPIAKPKSEMITFAVMKPKGDKTSAAIAIGLKVLGRLNWRVGDKVAIGIDQTTRKVQVYLAAPGQKHTNTLQLTDAVEPMAKFSFVVHDGMGIPLAKIKAQEATFTLSPRHTLAGFSLEPRGEDFELHIDMPDAPAAKDEESEEESEEAQVTEEVQA